MSSMLKVHSDALADPRLICYHEFLARYNPHSNVVYGFVEGKTDYSYYRGFIDGIIPKDWRVELWHTKGKKQVYAIYGIFDWKRFASKSICFFTDRDLSSLIPETVVEACNIYVTDKYSIENDLVSRETCERVLLELYGFHAALHEELDAVCDLFEQELEKFCHAMTHIMSWILHWRRTNETAMLDNIKMKDIFKFKEGKLLINTSPVKNKTIAEYLHRQVKIKYNSLIDISLIEKEFYSGYKYRKFVRGKYMLWFLFAFCDTIKTNQKIFFPTMKGKVSNAFSYSEKNGIVILANRCRIPTSLDSFLKRNYISYISSKRPVD